MKPDDTQTRYAVSSSPHVHSGASVPRIMLDVLIALLPAFVAACWYFGWSAVRLVVLCVGASVLTEWICRRLMRRDNTISDFSALLTGMLLAFNLPPSLPGWMAVLGSVFAIAVAKQIFGGLGHNPFNPALSGRAFLLISFTAAMTTWSAWEPTDVSAFTQSSPSLLIDGVTQATPLGIVKESLKQGHGIPLEMSTGLARDLFLGNVNGCIGETSALALLLGGVYLLWRKVITWHIPVAYLGTVAVFAAVIRLVAPGASMPVHFHLLAGGLMLGAWFMATDMVTTPVTRRGMLCFGIGCGLLTMVLRTVRGGAYPEGVSFAILIMNATTPLLNRATRPRVFGTRRRKHA